MDDTTIPSTTTTVIGPSGAAPGVSFVVPQSRAVRDSSGERSAGVPLLIAGIVLMVVFTFVFVRAWRSKRGHSTGTN